jgi:hypothetical protein
MADSTDKFLDDEKVGFLLSVERRVKESSIGDFEFDE